ncbi:MAG TPA: type II secretion system protein [Verrucomicrobiales bacterium]|jgi:prepilin-type N-terminal cleavage/methylation domain-containing protein|nr:type II secretion system protein [Verrucomicrobiales bacterium]
MRKLKTHPSGVRYSERGFGFAELLVVVAIVGVLTAIAIPALTSVFGRAETAKAGRNAQSLVSTFNAARAAGNSTNFANAGEAISAITTSPGIKGGGVYSANAFYVSMDPAEIVTASLKIEPQLTGTGTEGNLTIRP